MALSNALSLGSLFVELGLKTEGFNASLAQHERDIGNRFGAIRKVAATTSIALGAAFTGAFVGLRAATRTAADFEQSMNNIRATLGTGGTIAAMEQLEAVAIRIGKDTVFSAGDAALAIEELAKGGVDVAAIMAGAADSVVALSAASGKRLGLAESATFASQALAAFKLEATDLEGVVDLLAGTSVSSATDLQELLMAFRQSAAVAAAAGLPIEELITGLGLLAKNALVGSDAGTSLKVMLTRLIPDGDKAVATFAELGLLTERNTSAFFDATGQIKSLAEISELLNAALGDLTQEEQLGKLKDLFGQDAVRAGSIIMGQGREAVEAFQKQVGEVSAAEIAEKRMAGLAGAMEDLRGSFETLAIELAGPLLEPLEKIADVVGKMVDAFIAAPQPIKDLATKLAVGGTFMLAIGAVATGILAISGAVAPLITALWGTGAIAGVGSLGGVIGSVAALLTGPVGITALFVGLGAVWLFSDEVRREKVITFFQDLNTKGIQPLIAGTKTAVGKFEDFGEAMTEWAEDAKPKVKQWFDNVETTMARRSLNFVANLTGVGQDWVDAIMGEPEGGFESLGPAVSRNTENAVQAIIDKATEVDDAVERTFRVPLKKATSLLDPGFKDAMEEVGKDMPAAGRDVGNALDTAIVNDIAPPIEEFEADLRRSIPDGLTGAVGDLNAVGGPAEKWQKAVEDDLQAPVAEVGGEFEGLSTTFETEAGKIVATSAEVAGAVGGITGELTASQKALAAWGADIAAIIDDDLTSEIPGLFGDAFADVVTGLGDFEGVWTTFTDGLKRVWNNTLSDLFASFVSAFVTPVSTKLAALASSALGVGQSAVGSAAQSAVGSTVGSAVGSTVGAGAGAGVGAGVGAGTGAGAGATLAAAAGVALALFVAGAFISLPFTEQFNEVWTSKKPLQRDALPSDVLDTLRASVPDGKGIDSDMHVFQEKAVPTHYTLGVMIRLTTNLGKRKSGFERGMYTLAFNDPNRPFTTPGGGSSVFTQPTQLGLRLISARVITPSDIGLPEWWLEVAQGVTFGEVGRAAGVAEGDIPNFVSMLRSGISPAVAAQRLMSPGSTGAAGQAPGTFTGGSDVGAGERQGNIARLSSAFLLAAQAASVAVGDFQGFDIIPDDEQLGFAQEVAAFAQSLEGRAADLGLSLADLPIGTTLGTFAPDALLAEIGGGSRERRNEIRVSLNIDQLFATEENYRTLARQIQDILAQEGLA